MKCDKNCSSKLKFETTKKNYICAGINKKPTKYKKDIIQLCLKGFYGQTQLEMTVSEASCIISVLGATISEAK